jgi:predicted MFS family arabinose efflux permease
VQALWRGAGTALALLGGGVLLSVGQAAPFACFAVVYIAAVASFVLAMARRGIPDEPSEQRGGVGDQARHIAGLLRDKPTMRTALVAIALWELSLGALKTFIVLYVTEGLGFSRTAASFMIGGVAVVVLVAAVGSGKVADRVGETKVLRAALPVYGLGMLVPLAFSARWLIAAAVPFIAIGGGVIMALPYALLMPLMPDDDHGAITGLYSLSRGVGTWLGPLLGGVAITALAGSFTATRGYQAMWLVCSSAVLLSLVPLSRIPASA